MPPNLFPPLVVTASGLQTIPPNAPPPSPVPTYIQWLSRNSLNHSEHALSVYNGIYGGGTYDDTAGPKEDIPKNKIYNIPLLDAFSGKFRSLVKQDGEIGLEIECEGTNLFSAPIQWWQTHQDGSLRSHGDHPPIEYVLRKPVPREDVPKALSYLTKKLNESGSTIDDSPRTSVHVHLNCQRLTIKQIYQVICLYLIFEERLVEFSGPDRIGNLFCLRAKDADHFIQILEQAIQNENFNDLFSDNLRYASCNTASLGKFGSLEFRSMRGTVDQELIQLWVDLLTTLKDKALEYDNPRDIVDDFQRLNTEKFLQKIFGHRRDLMSVFSNWNDRHTSMWDGLRMMRDVACAVKWEKQNTDLLKKKGRIKSEPSAPALVEYVDQDYANAVDVHYVPDGTYTYCVEDTRFIKNFSNATSVDVPVNGRYVHIGPRRVYKLTTDGRYAGWSRELNQNEYPPDDWM